MNDNSPTAGKKQVNTKTYPMLVYQTYDDWLRDWEDSRKYTTRVGLLHELQYNNRIFRREYAVPLLLEIADGYLNIDLFCTKDDENAHFRHKVALKALSVLCVRFFKADKPDSPPHSENRHWWWMLSHSLTHEAVLKFFRFEGDGIANCSGNRLSTDDHEQRTIQLFLREFSRLMWTHVPSNYGLGRNLMKDRPQCIEIMYALGELHWLFGRDLDAPCVEKLNDIAMREKLYFPREKVNQPERICRKATSLEEAVLGGSDAAYVLAINNICLQQKSILEGRYEVSAAEERAQKDQERLQKNQERLEELERERAELLRVK